MSKGGAFGKIVIWLLVVLLLFGVVGLVLFFVMQEQDVTYYVEYGGKQYLANSDGSIELSGGETHEFFVKSLTGGEVEFDVKITSNSDNNIAFAYNEEYRNSYTDNADTNDYSEVFGLKTDTNGFTVAIPQDMTVETAIETKLGGDITLIDELSDSTAYFVVTVSVGKSTVDLSFVFDGQVYIPSSGIVINPPQIIF